MGFFDNFPYTNFHELNLDWLIKSFCELKSYVEQYTAVNNVSYAGIWDIAKQYPKWSIVVDGENSYLSKQPVPAGIAIDNDKYWLHMADLDPRISGIVNTLGSLSKYWANTNNFLAGDADVEIVNTMLKNNKLCIVPPGLYNVNKTLEVPSNSTLIFLGELHSTASPAIKLHGNSNLRLYYARGEKNNVGIEIATEPLDSVGNIDVEYLELSDFSTAIHLYATGTHGVQGCIFKGNRNSRCGIGIHLECGNEGHPWINENNFYNIWANFNSNETGIKTTKGLNQIDRFNGNRFINMSFEGCRTAISGQFIGTSIVENARMVELHLPSTIVLDSCNDMSISSRDFFAEEDFISDNGSHNFYDMAAARNGERLASYFTYRDGKRVLLPGKFTKRTWSTGVSEDYSRNAAGVEYYLFTGSSDVIYTLPAIVNYDTFGNQLIIVEVKSDFTGFGQIKDFVGNTIITNGGAWASSKTNMLLSPGVYLMCPRGATWWAVRLSTAG